MRIVRTWQHGRPLNPRDRHAERLGPGRLHPGWLRTADAFGLDGSYPVRRGDVHVEAWLLLTRNLDELVASNAKGPRDKIAASKAKGMWMGCNVPLGYDIPAPGTRVLRVNEDEASTVRHVFTRYLELRSVYALQHELAEQGILCNRRVTSTGKAYGGCPLNRGALFHLLANPVYLGRICHKGTVHEGGHDAIVSEDLFDKVQRQLAQQAPRKRAGRDGRFGPSPLAGKHFDATGERMTPTFARDSKGTGYRYYVSHSLQVGRKQPTDGTVRRIAAPDIEKVIVALVERWLPAGTGPLGLPLAVHLQSDGLLVDLPADVAKKLAANLSAEERVLHADEQALRVHVPLALPLRGGRPLIVAGAPLVLRDEIVR